MDYLTQLDYAEIKKIVYQAEILTEDRTIYFQNE